MKALLRLGLIGITLAASVFVFDACSQRPGSAGGRPGSIKPQALKRVGPKGVLPISVVKASSTPPSTPVNMSTRTRSLKIPKGSQKDGSGLTTDVYEGEDFYLWFCVEAGAQLNGVDVMGRKAYFDAPVRPDPIQDAGQLTSSDVHSGSDYFTGLATIKVPPCDGQTYGYLHLKIPANYLANHVFDPDGSEGEIEPVTLDIIRIYVTHGPTEHTQQVLLNIKPVTKTRQR